MKKYLYTLLFMAVALFGATTLVSCGGDDDDFPGGGDKPATKKIDVYAAYVSADVFELCDISLTLHSGDKSKTVKLDKASGKLVDVVYSETFGQKATYPGYQFIFDNVDGNLGIDKVDASATLKSGAAAMIDAMGPEAKVVYLVGSALISAEFQTTGKYSFEAAVTTGLKDFGRTGLLGDINGTILYETLPSNFARNLSK